VSPLGLLQFGWRDLLEIALVAYILYRGLLLISGTRALQMLAGLVVLGLAYVAAWLLKLTMVTWLLGLAFTYGAFAAVVIFQPELRAALANLGQRRLGWLLHGDEAREDVLGVLADTAFRLARLGIGAIIAIERDVSLGSLVQAGTPLAAQVQPELLTALFARSSPLHDGAVIVRGDRIIGAGCILPLTSAPLDRSYGTRHRAALGLSEDTDAVVICVSEEREEVSVALGGTLRRVANERDLRTFLLAREENARR
jgi:diadenylate cyclase